MEWVTLDVSSLSHYFTIAKDVVIMVTAFYAAVVATRGLTTWNRQLKGSAEYDLARRILKYTYRLREAITGVRNPVMFPSEMPAVPEDVAKTMSEERIQHYGKASAYQTRLQKVVDARDELRMELLEAEALWGDELLIKYIPLFELQGELFTTVHVYMMACNPDTRPDERRAYEDSYSKKLGILYHNYSDETSDKFLAAIKSEIKKIEAFLKPHLLKT